MPGLNVQKRKMKIKISKLINGGRKDLLTALIQVPFFTSIIILRTKIKRKGFSIFFFTISFSTNIYCNTHTRINTQRDARPHANAHAPYHQQKSMYAHIYNEMNLHKRNEFWIKKKNHRHTHTHGIYPHIVEILYGNAHIARSPIPLYNFFIVCSVPMNVHCMCWLSFGPSLNQTS